MNRRWPRRLLLGASMVWLVEITFAGRVWRLARELVDVESDDGTLTFVGGLEDIQVVEALPIAGEEPEAAQADLELVFPDDVAELVAHGHRLDGAQVVVAQWIRGTSYEERLPRLVGRAVGTQFGASTEPIRLRVEGRALDDRSSIPDPAAKVTARTWPDAPEASVGRVYPEIIGAPGAFDADGTTKGSPGIAVSVSAGRVVDVLVAGHVTAATSVTVMSSGEEGTAAVVPVSFELDGAGRRVAVVDISGQSNAFRSTEADFWVRWHAGGGMLVDDRSRALETGGEVLTHMLRRATFPVDLGRCAAAEPLLRGYRFAGYINEPVSAWGWVRAQLLPNLPVALVQGPEGLYPVVWRRTVRPAQESVAHLDLDADPTLSRVGDLGEDHEDPVNRVSIAYGLDADTGDYRGSALLGGSDAASHPILLADLGQREAAQAGERRRYYDLAVEVDISYERVTAMLVGKDALALRALPSVPLTLIAPSPAFEFLEVGDVVTVTSSELAVAAREFRVVRVERGDDAVVGIMLRHWRQPGRDRWAA